jgi:hypothetical protein
MQYAPKHENTSCVKETQKTPNRVYKSLRRQQLAENIAMVAYLPDILNNFFRYELATHNNIKERCYGLALEANWLVCDNS